MGGDAWSGLEEQLAHGRIILLNGASSAGKTSIARALQNAMEPVWHYVSLDHFLEMLTVRCFGVDTPDSDPSAQWFRWRPYADERGTAYVIEPGPLGDRHIFEVMHPAIRAIAASGRDVIVDDVLLTRGWLLDYLSALEGVATWFVKVHCPLDVLEARERERGDRNIGQARGQHARIHEGLVYDLELDTSLLTPEECAARIRERVSGLPTAFAEMRRLFAVS